MINKSIVN